METKQYTSVSSSTSLPDATKPDAKISQSEVASVQTSFGTAELPELGRRVVVRGAVITITVPIDVPTEVRREENLKANRGQTEVTSSTEITER
jgi:hypothetical protein